MEKWFEHILWQTKWQYPRYYTNGSALKVDTYDLVPIYEYTQNKNFKMPYNVTHGIYPRCAYDDVSDNYTIFMLRCPSVIKEK